jgi:hypothetical protein
MNSQSWRPATRRCGALRANGATPRLAGPADLAFAGNRAVPSPPPPLGARRVRRWTSAHAPNRYRGGSELCSKLVNVIPYGRVPRDRNRPEHVLTALGFQHGTPAVLHQAEEKAKRKLGLLDVVIVYLHGVGVLSHPTDSSSAPVPGGHRRHGGHASPSSHGHSRFLGGGGRLDGATRSDRVPADPAPARRIYSGRSGAAS